MQDEFIDGYSETLFRQIINQVYNLFTKRAYSKGWESEFLALLRCYSFAVICRTSSRSIRLRNSERTERLINLVSLSYSTMTLLPYNNSEFSNCQTASAQKILYEISQQIQASKGMRS